MVLSNTDYLIDRIIQKKKPTHLVSHAYSTPASSQSILDDIAENCVGSNPNKEEVHLEILENSKNITQGQQQVYQMQINKGIVDHINSTLHFKDNKNNKNKQQKNIFNQINPVIHEDPSTKLDLNNVGSEYRVIITDSYHDSPFLLNPTMLNGVHNYVKGKTTPNDKAHAIFNYMQNNINYGKHRGMVGYRNSEEVQKQKQGVCGEMAYLYVILARSLGLKSNFVNVDVDNKGKKVHHACASVNLSGRNILVDPAYHGFDIKHRRYNIVNDRTAERLFKQWRAH